MLDNINNNNCSPESSFLSFYFSYETLFYWASEWKLPITHARSSVVLITGSEWPVSVFLNHIIFNCSDNFRLIIIRRRLFTFYRKTVKNIYKPESSTHAICAGWYHHCWIIIIETIGYSCTTNTIDKLYFSWNCNSDRWKYGYCLIRRSPVLLKLLQ